MNFGPKKIKYKKHRKGKNFNKVSAVRSLIHYYQNIVSLRALESARLDAKQIDSIKQLIRKIIKKSGRIKYTVFADVPVSKKPNETRMGKGKGNVDFWAAKVNAGSILYQLEGSNISLLRYALVCAQQKLSINSDILVI